MKLFWGKLPRMNKQSPVGSGKQKLVDAPVSVATQ